MTLLAGSLGASTACVVMARSDASRAEEAEFAVNGTSATRGRGGAPAAGALLHAGGLLADATVPKQTAGRVALVAAPKVGGLNRVANAVGAAAAGNTLLFSSLASMLGSGGQANYVAANGWLDAWAVAATARGQSAASVQWGAWSGGGGMAANEAGTIQRMERLGVGAVEPSQGLRAVEGILRGFAAMVPGGIIQPVVAASPFVWETFLKRMKPVPALFDGVNPLAIADTAAADSAVAGTSGAAAGGVSHRGGGGTARGPIARALVDEAVLNIIGSEVDDQEPLVDAGLDSLGEALHPHACVENANAWLDPALESEIR